MVSNSLITCKTIGWSYSMPYDYREDFRRSTEFARALYNSSSLDGAFRKCCYRKGWFGFDYYDQDAVKAFAQSHGFGSITFAHFMANYGKSPSNYLTYDRYEKLVEEHEEGAAETARRMYW